MLRLNELKLPLEHGEADLTASICRRLKLAPEALRSQRVVKRSVDARKKAHIQLTYSVEIELEPALEQKLLQRFRKDPHLQPAPNTSYQFVAKAPVGIADGAIPRPVVIGAGPCGYFCALVLAQMGYRPLLLERGKPVKERSADTFGFWKGKTPFNPESNAQFGEGGAGTFSDGKLYSQVRDPNHYGRKVLEEFVAAGANPEILVLHRPHIGTFKLATVVRGLRAQIERLGGEIRFESRVDQISIEELNGQRRVRGVQLSDGSLIAADHVVVAVGHSARDTFTMLHANGVAMEAKPFSVGFRIEHPQPLIDQARWGNFAGHPLLGAAEYKLVHHASNGRCVYSFCMCPGGLVVGATSEEGRVVTNGMSQHSRNERNANSGIVVNIEPEDVAPYGHGAGDPLAGVAFQRHWESRAFELGGRNYAAPGQRLGDFLAGEASQNLGEVAPSYAPGVQLANLEGCLPAYVIEAMREALPAFATKIPGYAMDDAMLTGVETRTSSPVRLPRNTSLESVNTQGLYPAGEGAGYAGGILSAGIDGIRIAEAVVLNLRRQHPGAPGESACDPA
ncbi:FAD-dependent oxidoreductase [Synechococcus sp. HJ21-Hayes]|uniref:NAD(P)/FAD-dependent oxidoreductase n=1 Tax=unclassified Synechococcus TaxID=2626047 RepID=UPI0020CBBEDE|nr:MULTISPECIES: FAD-dependent oxidoreductase [unclassified Synechococcus]MCP9830243.1 FAD-dependent oxidoreductase [Synechococcus sp. JJ3a-Johnson]MCP9851778.1 FAD-dependent oxidoreductase [Synechococcus sp. HJ21-Hayes]